MKLSKRDAEVYVPDGAPLEEALSRTTFLAVSAHQDDIEIMAYDGILKCFGQKDAWFTGVVVTNGSGSPRDGVYASCTDEEMRKVRSLEQKKAAFVGEYSVQFLLDHTSNEVKDPQNREIIEDLKGIFTAAKPKVIYTHNPADKHDTHVATVLKVISAVRELPEGVRPERLYGCEVWRDLDWLPDEQKIIFNLSGHENLSEAIMGVFDSQICGGKRYDQAVSGRRRANATFFSARSVDMAQSLGYAMDLTPLIKDINLDVREYILNLIKNFRIEVSEKIKKFEI